jgi:hypothetical protein
MRTWRRGAVAALLCAAASAKDGGFAITFLDEEAALWKKRAKELDRIFGEGEEQGHGEEEGK